EVTAGECVCLLGRNGVGKSTTMRSIMGLTPPQSGRVAFRGVDITGWESYRVARAGIGFVPEDRRIFADLTVWENLDVAQRGTGGWTPERVFDLFPTLRQLTGRNGGYLSGGEQQMLTIARTLMGNPELLLLDEPSEGVAPLAPPPARPDCDRPDRVAGVGGDHVAERARADHAAAGDDGVHRALQGARARRRPHPAPGVALGAVQHHLRAPQARRARGR